DPQVDDPPAPVFGHGQVSVLPDAQAGAVEAGDGQAADQEQGQERPVLAGPPQRRPQAAGHQPQPQEQPDQQQQLPEPAQVHVLITLVAEPEPDVPGELLLDAQPLAGQRAADHEDQGGEQDVDAQALALRLAAADGRGHEQAGRQPGGRDPEDAELQVPGPRH